MIQGKLFPMNDKEKELLKREEEEVGHRLEEIHGGPEYGMCFACGEKNPIGLHLHFFETADGCLSFFTPSHEHQSYNDRMHGGLIMTLMDEVMGELPVPEDRYPRIHGKDGVPVPFSHSHRGNGEGNLPGSETEGPPGSDGG